MGRSDGGASSPRRLPKIGLAVALVAGVAWFVRSPTTLIQPDEIPVTEQAPEPEPEPTPTPPTPDPASNYDPWVAISAQPPVEIDPMGPGVWNGRELVVGFSPNVAAFTPLPGGTGEWRELPPLPGPGGRALGATLARGAEVFVVGPAQGCPCAPSLYALDLGEETWRQLPDAPAVPSAEDAQVVEVGGEIALVRSNHAGKLSAHAFDPATETWRSMHPPRHQISAWHAVGAGEELVVMGSTRPEWRDDGTTRTTWLYDSTTENWHQLYGGPLENPQIAASVWTGDSVVLFGATDASVHLTRVSGAALNLREGTWRSLPAVPLDEPMLAHTATASAIPGMTGVWDGEQAVFVSGWPESAHVAWQPDDRTWQVRRPPLPRVGAQAFVTRDQVLLWGGIDAEGHHLPLELWPAAP